MIPEHVNPRSVRSVDCRAAIGLEALGKQRVILA
jgi:hypothetical protein